MQRRALNAARKDGLSLTPSARALIIRLPIEGSLAQAGMSPQRTLASSRPAEPSARRMIVSSRPGLVRTMATSWLGAMLNRGAKSRGVSENSVMPKARSSKRGSA